MHYIIDGYNLLFWLKGDRHNLESLRRSFIQDIDQKAELLKMEITIIFDGHFQEDGQTRTHFRNVEIIYTSHGESADELIISELKSSLDVRNEVVVTSDRELLWRAKKLHAKTEKASEFYRMLQERYCKRQKRQVKEVYPKQKVKRSEKIEADVVQDNESLEYYQKVFEDRLKEEERLDCQRPKRKKSEGRKKIDDFNRWLKAFEKKPDEENF